MRNICIAFTNTHSAGSEKVFGQLAERLTQLACTFRTSTFALLPPLLKRQQNINVKANSCKFLQERISTFFFFQRPLNESWSLNISKEACADYFASLIPESKASNRRVAVAACACIPPI